MAKQRNLQRGVTLIETSVAMTIAAIAMGTAVGGFGDLRQRQRVDGTAQQLLADVQQLRFEAVAQSRSLRVSFDEHAGGSCYVLHEGDCRCDDQGRAQCTDGSREIKTVWLAAADGVRLASNVDALRFDPALGTVTPAATLRLAGGEWHLNVVVNLMGRARLCTPDASMPGQRPC